MGTKKSELRRQKSERKASTRPFSPLGMGGICARGTAKITADLESFHPVEREAILRACLSLNEAELERSGMNLTPLSR